MAVKEVTKWKASDGKEFTSIEAAERYESDLLLVAKIMGLAEVEYVSSDREMLHNFIFGYITELKDIFKNHK